jgi:hypothetical protein
MPYLSVDVLKMWILRSVGDRNGEQPPKSTSSADVDNLARPLGSNSSIDDLFACQFQLVGDTYSIAASRLREVLFI